LADLSRLYRSMAAKHEKTSHCSPKVIIFY